MSATVLPCANWINNFWGLTSPNSQMNFLSDFWRNRASFFIVLRYNKMSEYSDKILGKFGHSLPANRHNKSVSWCAKTNAMSLFAMNQEIMPTYTIMPLWAIVNAKKGTLGQIAYWTICRHVPQHVGWYKSCMVDVIAQPLSAGSRHRGMARLTSSWLTACSGQAPGVSWVLFTAV